MSPRVYSVHYTLFDPAGAVMDSTRERAPLTFVEGKGQILLELEEAILGLKAGDKKEVSIPSDHVFGPREEGRVMKLGAEQLPQKGLQIGQQFRLGGDASAPPATVIDVTGAFYIVDTNHPYSGMDLRFVLEVLEVREASEDVK